MKMTVFALAAAMAGTEAMAGEMTRVDVCVHGRPSVSMLTVEAIASEIMATAGVLLQWRGGGDKCPAGAIVVTLADRTPETVHQDALAFAVPDKGTVEVFADRVAKNYPQALAPHLLGHVLAHEITHVLEGVATHSGSDVMKVRWTPPDFNAMYVRSLTLSNDDIAMITSGMAARRPGELKGVVSVAKK
jgi:hypothetical protein